MFAAQFLGFFLALSSALVYGSADFYGGMATRRHHPYTVLTMSTMLGTAAMAVLAFVFGESWPSAEDIFWGCLAGFTGLFGLILLYYGLAKGNAAIVSPISGVISACVPVFYTATLHSIPSAAQITGFILAIPGIVLVTQTNSRKTGHTLLFNSMKSDEAKTIQDALIGGLAGIFFGLFFICLSFIKQGGIFGPLAFSKFTAFLIGLGLIVVTRPRLTSFQGNPAILLAGVLDPVANALYLLATRYTRLDIAAVLSSLYPVGTIFLSYAVLKERIQPIQWVGIGLCLLAIMLITS